MFLFSQKYYLPKKQKSIPLIFFFFLTAGSFSWGGGERKRVSWHKLQVVGWGRYHLGSTVGSLTPEKEVTVETAAGVCYDGERPLNIVFEHFHCKKSEVWHFNWQHQICLKILMKPNYLQAEKIKKALFLLMIESESQQLGQNVEDSFILHIFNCKFSWKFMLNILFIF